MSYKYMPLLLLSKFHRRAFDLIMFKYQIIFESSLSCLNTKLSLNQAFEHVVKYPQKASRGNTSFSCSISKKLIRDHVEEAVQRRSVKKVLLKVLQNS